MRRRRFRRSAARNRACRLSAGEVRRCRDYKRNGVTTLFAALNMLTGQVLSMTEGLASGHQLHRHQEWLRFLKMIDRQTP